MHDDTFHAESIEEMTLGESDWIIPGLVPTEGITIIDGRPKSGKSTFAMGIAMCVAQGTAFGQDPERFTGCLTERPSPVLWVGTDGRWKQELNKRRLHYPTENRGNLKVLDGRTNQLIFPAGHGPELGASLARWERFTHWATKEGFRVIILDHLLKIAGSRSINNDSDMSPVIGVLDGLVNAGIVPVLLHHQSVHGNNGMGMGHTVIHASMRSGLSLKSRRRNSHEQRIAVTTNENPEMSLIIKPLKGEPPVVLDFTEASKEPTGGDGRKKRERAPKDDLDLVRTRAILDGPERARENQTQAGKYLESLGREVMGRATYGRQLVVKLCGSGLLTRGPDGCLMPGPNWA